MKKKILTVIGLVLVLGAATRIYYTYLHVFHGRVVDADTKAPIEGAVVVAAWYEEAATPAGPTGRIKDVKETLTDTKGEWKIRGPKGGGVIASLVALATFTYYTLPPEFIVFKPGYCSWPKGFSVETCRDKVWPTGSDKVAMGVTVELPYLTSKEDRRRCLPSPLQRDGNGEFYSKQASFIRLINEESRSIGIGEYDTLKGYEK